FQEYFEKLGTDPRRWGKPVSALLGAYMAQRALGIAAIGGKDSMSGSFLDMDVPPTLVSFAVTTGKTADAVSPEFKSAGHRVVLIRPEYGENGLPEGKSLKSVFSLVTALLRSGKAVAAWTPGFGGVAEGIMKMCLGNSVGFQYSDTLSPA
ncbi:MAG TPA: phosphoribosylformylglycinamidine synthase, partial [Clostridiales bacterium]|nr:phosphoribosylformylglycinamidine synthase [Clostridiales bacterium]